jgi:hypothetical protein
MTALINLVRRTGLFTVAIVMFAISLSSLLIFAHDAGAAQITTRSLRLASSANGTVAVGAAGTGGNGAQTRHTFNFTEGTVGATVGSIEFLYCTTPLPGTTCTAPVGLDASTVTSVGGTTASGWSLGTSGNAPTANNIRITRTASNITDTQNIAFGNGGSGTDYIKNPTADNEEFFVRITTYATNAWGTVVDQGTVANSTAEQIEVTAKVQETLNFSVGTTPTDPLNSCVSLTGSALGLGLAPDYVLDFNTAYDARSYFRVSTNANIGTAIYYSGDTLKFGGNDIAAIGTTATASDVGTEQFGLAIDVTDATAFGHLFNSLIPQPPYDNGDGTITDGGDATFAYDVASVTTPALIADSTAAGTKTIICDTGSVRYLGNISTTTPPGVYTSTITYLATPTY